MKKTEKNNFEKIKEKIGKETGYIIKNLNSKNAKKELEKFIYTTPEDLKMRVNIIPKDIVLNDTVTVIWAIK